MDVREDKATRRRSMKLKQFAVDIPRNLHTRMKIITILKSVTASQFVTEALEEKIERSEDIKVLFDRAK